MASHDEASVGVPANAGNNANVATYVENHPQYTDMTSQEETPIHVPVDAGLSASAAAHVESQPQLSSQVLSPTAARSRGGGDMTRGGRGFADRGRGRGAARGRSSAT